MGTSVVLPAHSSCCTVSLLEGSNLSQLYCKLYSISDPSNIVKSTIFMRYSCIVLCNKQLGSHNTRSASSSTIMATWDQQLLGICCAEGGSRVIRAARINYFCKHTVSINGVNTTHLLAHLSWILYHPSQTSLGKPLTIWYNNLFAPSGMHTLLPVQFIKCRAVSTTDKLAEQDKLLLFHVFTFMYCIIDHYVTKFCEILYSALRTTADVRFIIVY